MSFFFQVTDMSESEGQKKKIGCANYSLITLHIFFITLFNLICLSYLHIWALSSSGCREPIEELGRISGSGGKDWGNDSTPCSCHSYLVLQWF